MTVRAASALRWGVYFLAAGLVVSSAVVLWVDGRIPAPVPDDAPASSAGDLLEAFSAIDSRGLVNLEQLKARHAALERHVASLAREAPSTNPTAFSTPDDRVAFWLNTFQALTLMELLDARGTTTNALGFFHAFAVGGQRLTRHAIWRRYLSDTGDARVLLAVFDGSKGHGVPDGAPFSGPTLDAQLDDAVRRFMARNDNVHVDGKTVHLSGFLHEHEAELKAALPPDRQNVLQLVWAYLPEHCDDGLGCDTRSDLDHACGTKFDACAVVWEPVSNALAVTH